MTTQPQPAGVRKVTFLNAAAETVPAYGVVQLGAPSTINGRVVFSGSKYSGGDVIYFNGPVDVAVGATGEAFQPNTAQWVLYDTGDTPAFGEDWGPVSNQWEIYRAGSGVRIMGGETSGRVLALEVPTTEETHFEGYLCADLSAAESVYNAPATATAIKLIKNVSGDLEEGTQVTITNRDSTLTLEAGTYIIWTTINGENRIIWAACQADISSSCPEV